MKKLAQLLLLAAGCSAPPVKGLYRYESLNGTGVTLVGIDSAGNDEYARKTDLNTHKAYMHGPVQQSQKEDARVAGIYFMTPETVADLLGNANREAEKPASLEKIAYKAPMYFSTEVALPKEFSVDAENSPSSEKTYTMRKDSNRIHIKALDVLLTSEQKWKKVESPYELAGKDANFIVYEVQKAHSVVRCTSGEHVLLEKDFFVLASVKMATKEGTKTLTAYHPDFGVGIFTGSDYEGIPNFISEHNDEVHLARKEDRPRFDPPFRKNDFYNSDLRFMRPLRPYCDPRKPDHCPRPHK